jgi:EmrB/QacA subfamily drug resistance transporter
VPADTSRPSRSDPDISTPPGRAAADPTGRRRRRLTLLAMCVATFMIQLDVTIVNVALPSIQRDLRVSAGALEWVISGYALSLAALIPVSGALGDRYGRRRVFLAGIVIFAVGSAACALSPDEVALVAFRVLQGAGGAAMLALTLSIITETFPPQTRAGAIGTWAAVGGTGFGVGPAAGGILLTFFGWASVFWVNVPLAVIAITITAVAVRPGRRSPGSRRLDLPGAAASAAGLFAVTFGLTESAAHPWASRPVAAPIVVGVAFLAGFAGWERRSPHPMIPPSLLRARSFVSASAVYLVSYTAFSGVLFYVTLLYQDVDHWSPLGTGLSWLFMNAPFLLAAQLAGRLDRRYPAAAVVATGCLAGAAGVFTLSLVTATTPFIVTAAGFLLCGAGFGLLVPGVTHVAMRDVRPETSGAASGALNASRQIGTSVGLAVLGTLGAASSTGNWTAFAHGYHLAVAVGAACLVAAAVIAFLGFRTPGTSAEAVAEPGRASRG